ncbi:crAss001_48 related protein [Acinetobacter brisouii]|uniref:crAss001_48 related protein n=1 Tax=Acinetobacter brisouii TaxID=396323 RepID=UPI00124D7DBB|nr:hypothetical protein [Acinetobacter brisouii]
MLKQTEELVKSLVKEFNETKEKREKLDAFLKKPKPEKISEQEWLVLHDQLDAMQDYEDCLLTRILIHTKEIPAVEQPVAASMAELDSE